MRKHMRAMIVAAVCAASASVMPGQALADDVVIPTDSGQNFLVLDLTDQNAGGCTLSADPNDPGPSEGVPTPAASGTAYVSATIGCGASMVWSVTVNVRPVWCGPANAAPRTSCTDFTTNKSASGDYAAKVWNSGLYATGWYRSLGGYDVNTVKDTTTTAIPRNCSHASSHRIHCYLQSTAVEYGPNLLTS
jgi:hypothetical protein